MKARARGMGANCVLGYQLADFHIAHDSNNIICVICLTGNAALYDEEIWIYYFIQIAGFSLRWGRLEGRRSVFISWSLITVTLGPPHLSSPSNNNTSIPERSCLLASFSKILRILYFEWIFPKFMFCFIISSTSSRATRSSTLSFLSPTTVYLPSSTYWFIPVWSLRCCFFLRNSHAFCIWSHWSFRGYANWLRPLPPVFMDIP